MATLFNEAGGMIDAELYTPIEQTNGDMVYMANAWPKLCVVVHHNGEPYRRNDTFIRKLIQYTFNLRYWGTKDGNVFEWANNGVWMDIFDYCDLRKHLANVHSLSSRRWDLRYHELSTKRVTGDLLCMLCYENGYPASMLLSRSGGCTPHELQAMEVIGAGYKELRELLSAALAHTHSRAGVPYDNDPRFFWSMEWSAELTPDTLPTNHVCIN